MTTRLISCELCGKPLGEIRDATLRVGIVHICQVCKPLIRAPRQSTPPPKGPPSPFGDVFGDIFGGAFKPKKS